MCPTVDPLPSAVAPGRSARATAARYIESRAALLDLLASAIPAFASGRETLVDATVREVITGRRGKLFASVSARSQTSDDAAPATRTFVLEFFSDDDGPKVHRRMRMRARALRTRAAYMGLSAYVAQSRCLVHPFPYDYRLDTLVHACDPAILGRELGRLLSLDAPAGVLDVRSLRYVPEKRCVLRYTLAGAEGRPAGVIGKVFANDAGGVVYEAMQALETTAFAPGSAGASIPHPIAWIAPLRLLLVEEAPGATLHDAILDRSATGAAFARAGRALAALHRAPLVATKRHTPQDELRVLEQALAKHTLGSAADTWGRRVYARLVSAVYAWRSPLPALVHRDFYDKQVLLSPERTTLIDFDTLAAGFAELDAGNFLAHITLRHLQGHLGTRAALDAHAAFDEAYAANGLQPDRMWLAWSAAATLLRLATIYAVRPGWQHLPLPLIQASESWLESGAPS